MRFYFVRHGQSEANVIRQISNRGMQHPLTELGRQQAADLAEELASSRAVKIYSSPLLRALQTSGILSQSLGIPFEVTDALREYDCGVIEDKSDAASWQIHNLARQEWLVHKNFESRIEGGESYLDIQNRFVPFLEGLLAEKHGHDESLILVGHGGLYMCILPWVLENVSFEMIPGLPFPNTGYVLAETRPEGLVCLEWCGQAIEGQV